jgi:hypothetical protein
MCGARPRKPDVQVDDVVAKSRSLRCSNASRLLSPTSCGFSITLRPPRHTTHNAAKNKPQDSRTFAMTRSPVFKLTKPGGRQRYPHTHPNAAATACRDARRGRRCRHGRITERRQWQCGAAVQGLGAVCAVLRACTQAHQAAGRQRERYTHVTLVCLSVLTVAVLGSHARLFRSVFDQANSELMDVFGMQFAELPKGEKVTARQKRGKSLVIPCMATH